MEVVLVQVSRECAPVFGTYSDDSKAPRLPGVRGKFAIEGHSLGAIMASASQDEEESSLLLGEIDSREVRYGVAHLVGRRRLYSPSTDVFEDNDDSYRRCRHR